MARGAHDLRTLRTDAGLSQQKLAERAGCSIHTVRLYERGYEPTESPIRDRILAVLLDERKAA